MGTIHRSVCWGQPAPQRSGQLADGLGVLVEPLELLPEPAGAGAAGAGEALEPDEPEPLEPSEEDEEDEDDSVPTLADFVLRESVR